MIKISCQSSKVVHIDSIVDFTILIASNVDSMLIISISLTTQCLMHLDQFKYLIAATTGELLVVFIAAFLVLALVNGIDVILGDLARQYLGATTIAYIAAIAFIIAGVLVIIGALLS